MARSVEPWTAALDAASISTLRALSVDQVQAARSGHIGMPLGAAPVLHTLYSRFLVSDPADPTWVNRDRFVLSAGHGSALLYSVLHLAGFGIATDDLRAFRTLGSITPGHPEWGRTPGVDATTGPLGQGIANAVGMAIAESMGAARLNTPDAALIDHHTFALVSDGDLMEGVAYEAMALAGVLRLGKLVAFYDENDVVIDGRASFVHDAPGVCRALAALGWHVSEPVDGEDVEGLAEATQAALDEAERPSLVRVRTTIGSGSRLADDPVIHSGAIAQEEATWIKRRLGPDHEAPFAVPGEVRRAWGTFADRGRAVRRRWTEQLEAVRADEPERAGRLESWLAHDEARLDVGALGLPRIDRPEPVRASGGRVLGAVGRVAGNLVGGSADLAEATGAYLPDGGDYSAQNREGRNIRYGIREHAMASVSNGIALHGLFRPFASTFAMFATYEANALRMAALQHLPVIHVLTHDTIAVGEDGPTHQPIEVLAYLRAIPEMVVVRPADAEESAAAWQIAIENLAGPTVLVMARGPQPQLDRCRAVGSAARGAYVLEPIEDGTVPDVVVAASGSELHLARDAALLLAERGVRAQVVSVLSHEVFAAQDEAYRASVLPPSVPRLVVEASHPISLHRLAGPLGEVYGIDRFGASAPPAVLLEEYGFTADKVADAAQRVASAAARELAR